MSVIQVKVRPGSRESALAKLSDGTFSATLKSPPVDGKANAELVGLIAEHFNVPKAAVRIKSGTGARLKRFVIAEP